MYLKEYLEVLYLSSGAALSALPSCACPSAFVVYTLTVVALVVFMVLVVVPRYGQTNIMVYIGICSLMGSLSVSLLSPLACQGPSLSPTVDSLCLDPGLWNLSMTFAQDGPCTPQAIDRMVIRLHRKAPASSSCLVGLRTLTEAAAASCPPWWRAIFRSFYAYPLMYARRPLVGI